MSERRCSSYKLCSHQPPTSDPGEHHVFPWHSPECSGNSEELWPNWFKAWGELIRCLFRIFGERKEGKGRRVGRREGGRRGETDLSPFQGKNSSEVKPWRLLWVHVSQPPGKSPSEGKRGSTWHQRSWGGKGMLWPRPLVSVPPETQLCPLLLLSGSGYSTLPWSPWAKWSPFYLSWFKSGFCHLQPKEFWLTHLD